MHIFGTAWSNVVGIFRSQTWSKFLLAWGRLVELQFYPFSVELLLSLARLMTNNPNISLV
jgi:hypothetical protein